jgi:hypothetical protein
MVRAIVQGVIEIGCLAVFSAMVAVLALAIAPMS